jgi:Fe-S cluster assembly ATP-binding protein
LKGIDLVVEDGETVILFGPNGVGKSSLFMTIMGFPRYRIKKGRILFEDRDITHISASERARMGIGMSFQNPPSIKGIKLGGLSELINAHPDDGERIGHYAKLLRLENHLNRDINLGFSGGEVKRSEIFQLLLQNPLLSLIDEPESGVDVENISVLGKALKRLLHKEDRLNRRRNSGIIITHTGLILNYLNADKGYMLIDGCLTCSGNAREIFELIQKRGYQECQTCLKRK